VRIPQQDAFSVSGTNGQMVGNLESGDYSVVSFTLVQKNRNSENLKVEMDYTDSIGERRSVTKEVSISFGSLISQNSSGPMAGGSFPGRQQNTSVFKSLWFWILMSVIILVIFYILYRKFPEKFKSFFNKFKRNKKEKNSKETPDWILSERASKKK
jgi:hypothetical protein